MAGGLVSSNTGAVSLALIGINVAAYLLTLATGGTDGSVFQHGAMLAESRFNLEGELLKGVSDGAYWRLLTSAFLHENILHIAFNMYALYLFGPFVEQALGRVRFIAAYLTMSVGASAFVYWLSDPGTLTIGASGAIFGLFGMALILLLKAKQDVTTLLVLLGINAFLSTQGNISWQGHLGGFVFGCLLGVVFAYAPRERRSQVQALAMVAMWIGIIAAIVLRTSQLTG